MQIKSVNQKIKTFAKKDMKLEEKIKLSIEYINSLH